MEKFTIEKNIHVTPRLRPKTSPFNAVLSKMEKGDSILFKDKKTANSFYAAVKAYERKKFKPILRSWTHAHGLGYRVWVMDENWSNK
tara:strand:+ start:8750 stop:9010 length:261 start_codon:yes stop_codon:yes gene_type:complete